MLSEKIAEACSITERPLYNKALHHRRLSRHIGSRIFHSCFATGYTLPTFLTFRCNQMQFYTEAKPMLSIITFFMLKLLHSLNLGQNEMHNRRVHAFRNSQILQVK